MLHAMLKEGNTGWTYQSRQQWTMESWKVAELDRCYGMTFVGVVERLVDDAQLLGCWGLEMVYKMRNQEACSAQMFHVKKLVSDKQY